MATFTNLLYIMVFYFPGPRNPKSGNQFPLHLPLFSPLVCPLNAELPLQLASSPMWLGDSPCLSPYRWGHVSFTITAVVAAWGDCGGLQTLSSLYHPSTSHLWAFQVSKGRAGSTTCAHPSSHPENNYSKSPTYEPSSCKLSEMRTCIWFQQGTRTCAINVRREWNCSLPSVSCCWRSFSSTISHLLSLLQSATLLACSLDASPCVPAVVLYYCTVQDTVR